MAINDPDTRLKLYALRARMAMRGITRRELCRRTGLSQSVIYNTCGGYASQAGPVAKRLIEVAVGMPVWSTPEEFFAMTQEVRFDAQRISQNDQPTTPTQ